MSFLDKLFEPKWERIERWADDSWRWAIDLTESCRFLPAAFRWLEASQRYLEASSEAPREEKAGLLKEAQACAREAATACDRLGDELMSNEDAAARRARGDA